MERDCARGRARANVTPPRLGGAHHGKYREREPQRRQPQAQKASVKTQAGEARQKKAGAAGGGTIAAAADSAPDLADTAAAPFSLAERRVTIQRANKAVIRTNERAEIARAQARSP